MVSKQLPQKTGAEAKEREVSCGVVCFFVSK